MQVKWNKKALTELDKAIAYCILVFGKQVTIQFYGRVMEFNELLVHNPEIGKAEPLLEKYQLNFRSIVIHEHFKLIYYIKSQTIHIADLWDIRREPQSLVDRIKNKKKG